MARHEIYLYSNSRDWIRHNAGAIFRPAEFIPAFEEFKNGLLPNEMDDDEYEDLVFLPILAHFLSRLPEFRGPKLVVLALEMRRRCDEADIALDSAAALGLFPACQHRVGLALDGEDVKSKAELLNSAIQRARRVGEIFSWDYSTAPRTDEIARNLTHQELVDIYIYSILEEEGLPEIPLATWPLDQAQKALDYVDRLWTGEPMTYGQVINGIPEFMYNPVFVGSIDDNPLYLLTDKETGKPTELSCDNGIAHYMLIGNRWGAMPNLEYFQDKYTFNLVKKHPALRYELIHKWDDGLREELDLEYFLDEIPPIRRSEPALATPAKSWKDPLTEEERERFYAIWAEKMPEVLTWTDDEIKMGMFSGM